MLSHGIFIGWSTLFLWIAYSQHQVSCRLSEVSFGASVVSAEWPRALAVCPGETISTIRLLHLQIVVDTATIHSNYIQYHLVSIYNVVSYNIVWFGFVHHQWWYSVFGMNIITIILYHSFFFVLRYSFNYINNIILLPYSFYSPILLTLSIIAACKVISTLLLLIGELLLVFIQHIV